MRKHIFTIILSVVIVVLFGWAVYDFVGQSNEADEEDRNEEGGGKIDAPPADDDGEVEEKEEEGLEAGYIAPDFELETWEGETVSLSDYRGQKVVVNFWATWCPPCRAEIPDFRKFYAEKDVEILAVNLTDTESDRDGIGEFIEEYEMPFPVLMDENSDVATEYEVMAYPTSYMLDEEGRIQYVAIGAMNYDIMVQEYEKMDKQ